MRGDRGMSRSTYPELIGSSPHAWGQAKPSPRRIRPRRFIPTCVGTGRETNRHQRRPIGSSPHAWGQASRLAWLRTERRFIPTCVGTGCTPEYSFGDERFIPTCVGTGFRFQPPETIKAVHPHMRGDRYAEGIESAAGRGSSPHAWGQVVLRCAGMTVLSTGFHKTAPSFVSSF